MTQSTSEKYCSHCFQRGSFTAPGINAEQMRGRVRNIARLERWRSLSTEGRVHS